MFSALFVVTNLRGAVAPLSVAESVICAFLPSVPRTMKKPMRCVFQITLTGICARFKAAGIRTSIFVDPDPEMVREAAACGCDRVELYTESYASGYQRDREAAIAPFIQAARAAKECGIGLNAGHDLNLENLEYYIYNIPWTDEVSIGHAIICDALYMGLEVTIKAYLSKIKIF